MKLIKPVGMDICNIKKISHLAHLGDGSLLLGKILLKL